MGVTEEETIMNYESKKKAGLPNEKSDRPFLFGEGKGMRSPVDALQRNKGFYILKSWVTLAGKLLCILACIASI